MANRIPAPVAPPLPDIEQAEECDLTIQIGLGEDLLTLAEATPAGYRQLAGCRTFLEV